MMKILMKNTNTIDVTRIIKQISNKTLKDVLEKFFLINSLLKIFIFFTKFTSSLYSYLIASLSHTVG